MKKNKLLLVFTILILAIGGILMSGIKNTKEETFKDKTVLPYRVLLIGASVGYEWKLPEWPKRMGRKGFILEMIPVYAFDKSEALEEVLMRPKRKFSLSKSFLLGFLKPALQKPDILIIKECAAYFPGDIEKYKTLVAKWVDKCKANNIKPVLATVVPVTEDHSQKRPGRIEGILEFNDWLRSFSKDQKIGCLDLEAALRLNNQERVLNPVFTSGDGLHLNDKGYKELDTVLKDYLEIIILQKT